MAVDNCETRSFDFVQIAYGHCLNGLLTTELYIIHGFCSFAIAYYN